MHACRQSSANILAFGNGHIFQPLTVIRRIPTVPLFLFDNRRQHVLNHINPVLIDYVARYVAVQPPSVIIASDCVGNILQTLLAYSVRLLELVQLSVINCISQVL